MEVLPKTDFERSYPEMKKAKEDVSLATGSSLAQIPKTPCKQRVLMVSILNQRTNGVNPQFCGWCQSALTHAGKSLEAITTRDCWGDRLGPLCRSCFHHLIKEGLIPCGKITTEGAL